MVASLQHRLAAAKSGDDVGGLLARQAQGLASDLGGEAGTSERCKLPAWGVLIGGARAKAAQPATAQVDQGGRQLVANLLGDCLGDEAGIDAAGQEVALNGAT